MAGAGLVEDGDRVPVRLDRAGGGEVDAAEGGQGGEESPRVVSHRPGHVVVGPRQRERAVDVGGHVAGRADEGLVTPAGEGPGRGAEFIATALPRRGPANRFGAHEMPSGEEPRALQRRP